MRRCMRRRCQRRAVLLLSLEQGRPWPRQNGWPQSNKPACWRNHWRMRRMLTLCKAALACLALASCGSTAGEVIAPPPQASMLVACAPPVALPDRALDDREIEVFWGRDRTALRECGARHEALAAR